MPLGHDAVDTSSVAAAWLDAGASLGSGRSQNGASNGLSPSQLNVLRLASLTIASVSIVSTMLANFWFLRMRRSFRHDLIILLIQSDMLKAIWFVILPAVELTHGAVESESAICQASGFFLSVGIEACDVSVVLVALHTALYIFRGGSGLYPHRRLAYGAFVSLPLLLASLAFINKPAYANIGRYCYLPTEPWWAREVLSWIPRYVILVTICATYVSTYAYVKILMRRFEEAASAQRKSPSSAAGSGHERRWTASVPPTPPIAYHGLIPPTPPRESASLDRKDRKLSALPAPAARADAAPARNDQRHRASLPESSIKWRMPRFGMDSALPSMQQDGFFSNTVEGGTSSRQSSSSDAVDIPPPSKSPSPLTRLTTTPLHFWSRSLATDATMASQDSPQSNIIAMLHRGPRSSDSPASVYLSPTALGATGMTKTRDRIRRKLRQLFIYPAVYIVVWFIPFILHLRQSSNNISFGLVLASLISMCFHGIADSLVFSILEKPWRHPRTTDSTCCFVRLVMWRARSSSEGTATNVGRTREEMLVDSKIARKRRGEELAERRLPLTGAPGGDA